LFLLSIFFNHHNFINFRTVATDVDLNKTITQLLVVDSNNALIVEEFWLLEIDKFSNRTVKYNKLKEVVMTDHYSFILFANIFMFEPFSRKVSQLIDSGIAMRNVDEHLKFKKPIDTDDEKRKLTLDHLGIWFIIWLLSLGIATLCFALEFCCSWFMTRLTAKFREYLKKTIGKMGVELVELL
jgi:hypothetical protein